MQNKDPKLGKDSDNPGLGKMLNFTGKVEEYLHFFQEHFSCTWKKVVFSTSPEHYWAEEVIMLKYLLNTDNFADVN